MVCLEATMNLVSEANRFLPWKVPSVPDVVSQQGAFLAKPGQSKKTVVAHENYWGKQMQRA
jgi:hypothetical protein